MKDLVKKLKKEGVLKTFAIIKAFKKVDRKDFVLENFKKLAYSDIPLPIEYGQTISQPYTVAFMLELLQVEKGDKVLDIGSGSGWQTALLAEMAGKKGKVFAFEIVPELYEFGKNNIDKYNFKNIEFFCRSAEEGLPKKVPFDKIIAGAGLMDSIPGAWKDQLKIGGRMVVPIKNSIWLYIRKEQNEFEKHEYSGFAFVPFV